MPNPGLYSTVSGVDFLGAGLASASVEVMAPLPEDRLAEMKRILSGVLTGETLAGSRGSLGREHFG